MAGLDPEDEDTPAPSTQAVDASSTPIHDAWQKWTSSPANNAALLQFGISMLQPRAPGQSGIGQFANAIGSSGEAMGREKAAEDADTLAEGKASALEADTAAKTSNAASAAANAAAYGRSVDNAASLGAGGKSAIQNALRLQGSLRTWMAKPEDPMALTLNNGVSNDPIVQALQRTHPDIKTKADILANPRYLQEAKQLLSTTAAVDDTEDPAGASAPAAAATPATPRTIYKGGVPYLWDGVNPPVLKK